MTWGPLQKGEKSFQRDRTENEWWDDERRMKRGKKVITISEKSEREFRSELRTEIRRYVKDTQRILKGISQGKYRRMLSL